MFRVSLIASAIAAIALVALSSCNEHTQREYVHCGKDGNQKLIAHKNLDGTWYLPSKGRNGDDLQCIGGQVTGCCSALGLQAAPGDHEWVACGWSGRKYQTVYGSAQLSVKVGNKILPCGSHDPQSCCAAAGAADEPEPVLDSNDGGGGGHHGP